MALVSGGELLLRTLLNAGVETIFGLHGAHIDGIFQACLDHGVPIVDTRHEVAAGHAAEGYARAADRLGVAMVTAGPGFTNVVTSLANAYLDRTPVLYISGAAGLAQAETNTLQAGIDQVAIARPVTKWAHQITMTADIPRLVAQAIRIATGGPMGPVLLDIPSDVLNSRVEEERARVPDRVLIENAPLPAPGAITQALDLLAEARRPAIMLGSGLSPRAAGAVRQLAETVGAPVYTDFATHGVLPSDHPLAGGTYHKLADLDRAEERPDLIIALGVRFGLFTVGTSGLVVPDGARMIHVEIDPREIGRIRAVDLPIVADPAVTAALLAEGAGARAWAERPEWRARVLRARRERRQRLSVDLARTTPPLHPLQAVTAVAEAITPDTIVIGDGAEAYHWLNEVIAQPRPSSYLTHGHLGAVGLGLGLALGAQASARDRPVVAVVGDGAVGFTIAEFDTMVRHDLPIVVVVMNNRSWAASQHYQELAIGPNRVTGTQLGGGRYDRVAAGFGADGVHVQRIEELAPAIRAAIAARRPTCINVEIDVGPIPPELHLLMRR